MYYFHVFVSLFYNVMFRWFAGKGLKQGVFWAVMIYLQSSFNDVLMKVLGESGMNFVEVSFFRYLISAIIVLIPMLKILSSGTNLFRSSMHGMHVMRGGIGAVALALCCYSVNIMPLAENTAILFSEAIFMLPLAIFFLKEKVSVKTWFATAVGFVGLIVMYRPSAANINLLAIVPTIAAILFAISCIMIKRMIDRKENNLTMLFYFGLYSTIVAGVLVPFYWTNPTLHQIWLVLLLGLGANLIQLFLFLAYRATTASNISPVRYLELPFIILFGFMFFGQVPDLVAIVGAALIVIGTIISSYSTNNKEK